MIFHWPTLPTSQRAVLVCSLLVFLYFFAMDGKLLSVHWFFTSSVLLLFLITLIIIGRVELRTFLILYLITLPLQLVTTGSFLEQGSEGLVIVTAIHAGAVLATFWSLLANAIVATQVVEDGSMSSIVVRFQLDITMNSNKLMYPSLYPSLLLFLSA